MKVGIPRGLLFNDFSPLFIPFFNYLGIKTIVSDETNRKIINRGLEIVRRILFSNKGCLWSC